MRGQLAEGLIGELSHLVRLDIAGYDEERIVRGIEALVEGERIVTVERGNLMRPTDDGDAVRVFGIERRHHLLLQNARRVVVDATAALFEDHVPLRRHVLLGEAKIGHAVSLHGHDRGQPILGHALEIGGDVMVGEGVVLAAVLGDDLGELAGWNRLGALEHQMLEEVGDA
jgi:hypothetical protein